MYSRTIRSQLEQAAHSGVVGIAFISSPYDFGHIVWILILRAVTEKNPINLLPPRQGVGVVDNMGLSAVQCNTLCEGVIYGAASTTHQVDKYDISRAWIGLLHEGVLQIFHACNSL